MPSLGEIRRRMWMFAHWRRVDRDLDAELRSHEDFLRARAGHDGATEATVQADARRRMGSTLRIREQTHDALGWRWYEDLAQDLRYAVRAFRARAGFAASVILILALATGGATAIFSVINGVLLRQLPFADPDRLIQLFEQTALSPQGSAVLAPADVERIRRDVASIQSLSRFGVNARYIQDGDERVRVMAADADRTLFDVLGVQAIEGRTFRPDDPSNVVIVSERFRREHLAGRPAAIGAALLLDGEPFTVVGVMSDAFQFPYRAASLLPGVVSEGRTDLWRPIAAPGQIPQGRSSVVARLAPGASIANAESELRVIAARIAADEPRPLNALRGYRVSPLADEVVAPAVRQRLFLLFGAVVIVLLLACANITNLSLVRTTLRRQELAVRAALGAAPGRLARQLLAEHSLLALTGGGIGLILAGWGASVMARVAGAYLPRADDIGFDWTVFAFLAGVCMLTAVIVSLAPIVATRRGGALAAPPASDARATMTRGQGRVRDTLVVVEVALACALAVGAAVIVREAVRLGQTPIGLDARNVVTFHLGHRMVPGDNGQQFYDVVERVAALNGVQSAAVTQLLPLQNWGWTSNSVDFQVRGGTPMTAVYLINLRYVTPGYFETLRIPIRRGRAFDEQDRQGAPPVILINEALARRSFGETDPIGAVTTRGQIVGVVADVRQATLDRPAEPEIYYPIAQNWSQVPDLGMSLVVRTDGPPDAMIGPIREAIRADNGTYAVFNVRTMEQIVADSLSELRIFLGLMILFAGLALVLALSGTYGVVRYVASARRREYAIRSALGADARQITRLVLQSGAWLVLTGVAIGTLLAVVVAPVLLENVSIAIDRPDTATIAAAGLGVGLVALIACWLPSRYAARADAATLLRAE